MGCCFSRPAGPNAPYPGGNTSPSARAINAQPPLHAAPTDESSAPSRPVVAPRSQDSPTSPTTQRRRRRSRYYQDPNQPLSQHIDKPLRRHRWAAKDRPWTRTALDTERVEFFDTRVTGRPEIWQVIKVALEVLWDDDKARRRKPARPLQKVPSQEQEPGEQEAGGGEDAGTDGQSPPSSLPPEDDEALATAQSMLKAAEVTLPTGDLANGVYDSLGNYYALHEWIVCDPINVAEDSGSGRRTRNSRRFGAADDDEGYDDMDDVQDERSASELYDDDDDDDDEAERRREAKGKAVAIVKDLVPVRARLSEGGARDVVVNIGLSESVRSLARKITEESNLPYNRRVRVAYMGKILNEGTSLEDQGWQKGHVVNAFVFNR